MDIDKKKEEIARRNLLVAVLIFCLLTVAGAVGWFFYRQSQYATYLNDKEGFEIKYPKTWTVALKPLPGLIVGFVAPKETALDVFRPNVAITSTDLSKRPLTLEQYAKGTEDQMKKVFKNIKVEEDSSVDLSGHPGKRMVLRAEGSTVSVLVVYAFIYQNKAYNITYMGTADRYLKDASIVRDMINSLKVYF